MFQPAFRAALGGLVALLALSAPAARAETVGKVGVDWIGNDILIDAIADPKVKGITCHITYFDRSVIDRLKNGNWFEDPSNNAIACRQTGPIEIGTLTCRRVAKASSAKASR